MQFNPHVKLYVKDENGNKIQVYPENDVASVIGLGDQKGDLIDRLEKLEKRMTDLENRVMYH